MTALPDGWRRTALGEVAETALGKMLDRGKHRGLPRVRYLRNVNVQWGRINTDDVLEMELADDERDRFGVEPGDLLVCEGGEIGRAAIWTGSPEYMAYQKALHRVRSRADVDSRFLLHQLAFLAQTNSFDRFATGSTIRHLPQQQLRRVPIIVPPLDEQRRIVDNLDDYLSRLDAANDYLGAASLRLESLRISALQRIASDQIDNGARLLRIADVATTALGKMLDAKRAAGMQTPYLRNINVRWGRVNADHVLTVPLTHDERNKFSLRDGDVLVCEGGEPGRCAVWRNSGRLMTFQKALHRVRVNRDFITPEFLALSIESIVRSGQADRLFTGTTIKHLTQEKLREIAVTVPSLDVQARILAHMESLETSRVQMASEVERSMRRSEALRRALLAAAFSGRLTGHSSDLDVAEEMSFA